MYVPSTIDFKPQTNNLKDILFEVKLVGLKTSYHEPELNNVPIKEYRAVVNTANHEILSVVSKNYHLISNQEALNLGKKAFCKLFQHVKEEDVIPYKTITTIRKTHCHIDLIHKDVNFNVWEQDTWLPFLRVTNSYNKTHKLAFELGFVRKLCSNGVIFKKKTVEVKFIHSKGYIPEDIIVNTESLNDAKASFLSGLVNLKRFYVNINHTFPLLYKSLNLGFSTNNLKKNQNLYNQYKSLVQSCNSLSNFYFNSEGHNAYAVLNVITDIISHQEKYNNLPYYSFKTNEYYQLISEWILDYTEAAEERDFKNEAYIAREIKFIEEINKNL